VKGDDAELDERLRKVDSAIIRLRERASAFVLGQAEQDGLAFDDKERVRSLFRTVMTLVGVERPESWHLPAAFRQRERINDLLMLVDPWKLPPKHPSPGEQIVLGLRAHGHSADEIEKNLRSEPLSPFMDESALRLIQEIRDQAAPPANSEGVTKTNPSVQGDEWISSTDLNDKCGLTPGQLRQMALRKRLHPTRSGKLLWYLKKEIREVYPTESKGLL
jgi:hypothetical protein